MSELDEVRVPEVCTLPTVEQPLRLTDFDTLFATSLLHQSRVSPSVLRWTLDLTAEAAARDLTARETECCSFFSFSFVIDGDALLIDVQVPPAQAPMLDALATRSAAAMGSTL